MKIEKLPSGSYRVRKMVKGIKYDMIFDHKPSQKEITLVLAEKLENDKPTDSGTFKHYAEEYINNRSNVLSPSTIRSYKTYISLISDKFNNTNLYDITQNMVQIEINNYAATHAAKTTRNLHGFIASVLAVKRPSFVLTTNLPQNVKKERYLPSDEDIRRILDASIDSEEHVAFQLGILSLRRAEVCALTLKDIKDCDLSINKDMVYGDEGWVIKPCPKNDASNRTITLPQQLVDEIRSQGYIYRLSPQKLNQHLHDYQKQLGIPEFRFHDLRHYFASYAHALGIPDADILAIGGWSTDNVMKNVYRESMETKRKANMQKISNMLLS